MLIDEDLVPEVFVAKLFDGSLSVRVGNKEVYVLPVQQECTMDDIHQCLESVVAKVVEELPELPAPEKPHYPGW